jgi:S-methylmethionine-dependent homocysteine/selenocysteine methylase
MSHRDHLPQLDGERLFLTDGGLETTLLFHHGIDLPCFAAFDLLRREGGERALRAYFEPYLGLAREHEAGFVLDTPTWRASADWGARLGYAPAELAKANRRAVALVERLREEALGAGPIVLSGAVGPRGDGYAVGEAMSAAEAAAYHHEQLATFADSALDMVSAYTLTYAEEAVGIVRAAGEVGLPAAISFTVETDGRLPSGQALGAAIEQVDAATDGGAAYFMVNCAHPTHFAHVLAEGGAWVERIGGLRANASTLSHAELDEAQELDDGDPAALGAQYRALRGLLARLNVVGGCCGTDHRHVEQICVRWAD